ncbi:MAG: RDD family protein [Thermoanaerobaculia bacterium]
MLICRNHPEITAGVVRCSRCMVPYCSNCLVRIQGKPFCGTCKIEHVTDVRSGVSPDELELAGIGRRFVAIWLDGFILAIPVMVVVFVVIFSAALASGGKSEPPGWVSLAGYGTAVIFIVYEGLMLGARGQTLGKMAMKIKVVSADGGDISKGQAWGRSVMRAIFVSLLSLINYLPAFFTKEKTCIHDMAAKTRVILWR